MISKLSHWFLVLRYYLSDNKRELDGYMRRIRNLEPLTDKEWREMKNLALKEQKILHQYKSGFERIMYRGSDIITGAKIRP